MNNKSVNDKIMSEKFQTIKIWKKTLGILYFVKAYTHESIVSILDRLVNEELVRVQREENKPCKK